MWAVAGVRLRREKKSGRNGAAMPRGRNGGAAADEEQTMQEARELSSEPRETKRRQDLRS